MIDFARHLRAAAPEAEAAPRRQRERESVWGLHDRLGNRGMQAMLAGHEVPATPLTDEDRAVDLRSPQLRDEQELQDAFDDKPPIRPGHSSEGVRKVQQALIDLGYLMPTTTKKGTAGPDGIYGDETLKVIRGFQFRMGIQVDGIIGRQTLGELDGLLTGMTAPGTPTPKDATTITAVDVRPQQFLPCGGFDWAINWSTDGTNGFIVQEVTKTLSGSFCGGERDTGLTVDEPHFWEAWRVQTDGSVHGSEPNDTFATGLNVPDHRGSWSISGRVFWTRTLDPAAGFRFNGVAGAGGLLSTTTQPSGLGPALLTRSVGGTWVCCDGQSSHVPMTAAPPDDAGKKP